MTFESLEEFEKDVKRLSKKYRSLPEDLEVVKQVLTVFPGPRPPFSFEINQFGIESCVIKVKKIACKSLKGRGVNSGLRLIYAHFEKEEKIVFVELYHKNDQNSEDRHRITTHFH